MRQRGNDEEVSESGEEPEAGEALKSEGELGGAGSRRGGDDDR